MKSRPIRFIVLLCLMAVPAALAQDNTPPDATAKPADNAAAPEAPAAPSDADAPVTEVEMKPTELGVRFTPGIARAIAKQMSREMKSRYDLSDDQVQQAQDILARNMMKMAQHSQEVGRDVWETLMESMIANDGSFSKDDGQRWAKSMNKLMPDLKAFLTTSAAQIGKTMTLSQRLKLTAEMSAVSAGFITFEERMKRWEKGDVPDFANPFREPEPAPAKNGEPKAADTGSPEVQQARNRVERRVEWEIGVDERWTGQVEAAIEYYKFNDAQAKSARAILKEALERAKQVKTPEWTERLRLNRTAAAVSNRATKKLSNGPWMWQLDRDYEEILKPLQDIGKDMRGRIDEIAETGQRSTAAEQARQELSKTGLDLPPT